MYYYGWLCIHLYANMWCIFVCIHDITQRYGSVYGGIISYLDVRVHNIYKRELPQLLIWMWIPGYIRMIRIKEMAPLWIRLWIHYDMCQRIHSWWWSMLYTENAMCWRTHVLLWRMWWLWVLRWCYWECLRLIVFVYENEGESWDPVETK